MDTNGVALCRAIPNTLPELIQAGPLRVSPIVKSNRNPFNDRIFIGRAKNTDIVLEDDSVSKVHAYFEPVAGGRWIIRDFGSRNGTLISGRPLEPHTSCPVADVQPLQFGLYRAFFVTATALHGLLRQRIIDENVGVAV